MGRQIINTNFPNGDPGYIGAQKINDNFAELYARVAALESGTATPTPAPAPSPTLSLSSAVVQNEGNSGTSGFVWTLTLARNGSTAAFPYNYAVTGNAADAADFGGTFPSGSGTFAAGETTKTITILVTGDTAVEASEGFILTVTAAGLNTVTSNGTISNDDVAGGPLTTMPVPASGAVLWTLDPDTLTGADGSRVTSYTDPGSGITAIAPQIGPILKTNVKNGHKALRYAANIQERLNLGRPAAITAHTAGNPFDRSRVVGENWSAIIVVNNPSRNDGLTCVFGDDYQRTFLTAHSGGAAGAPFNKFAGDVANDIHTLVLSAEFFTGATGRIYRNGVLTSNDVKSLGSSTDIFIGAGFYDQNPGFDSPYAGDILYIVVFKGTLTAAQALQAHLWACNRFGKASPLAGRTYFPVFDGDSITYGTGATQGALDSTSAQLAVKRGWTMGAWANVGKPSSQISNAGDPGSDILGKAARDVEGYQAVTGLPIVIVYGEWHNQGTGGGTSGEGVNVANLARQYATARKASGKITKTIAWTSTSTTREGTARDAFNASLVSTPGDFDAIIPVHTNNLIGINGAKDNVTYFGDQVHPTTAGYTVFRDVIDTGMIAAGYST